MTPIYCASYYGHLEVAKLLIHKGAIVNFQNDKLQAPLHTASAKGNLEVVRLLIQNEANVNCENKGNVTPLHIASEKGFILHLMRQTKIRKNLTSIIYL